MAKTFVNSLIDRGHWCQLFQWCDYSDGIPEHDDDDEDDDAIERIDASSSSSAPMVSSPPWSSCRAGDDRATGGSVKSIIWFCWLGAVAITFPFAPMLLLSSSLLSPIIMISLSAEFIAQFCTLFEYILSWDIDVNSKNYYKCRRFSRLWASSCGGYCW